MAQTNKFFLNGQKYSVNQAIHIFDLINYFNYNESLLILEHNNLVCHQKNWKNILIKDQDKIEIITIVGGG